MIGMGTLFLLSSSRPDNMNTSPCPFLGFLYALFLVETVQKTLSPPQVSKGGEVSAPLQGWDTCSNYMMSGENMGYL